MNLRPPGYEPGELPDCSTPRREGKDSIRLMPWWTWVALGIFVASLVAASVIGILMLVTLKSLQVTSLRLSAALEDLAAKGEALERRSAEVSARAEAAEADFAHLRETLDRFSVLTWAMGDVAKTIGELRSAVAVRK